MKILEDFLNIINSVKIEPGEIFYRCFPTEKGELRILFDFETKGLKRLEISLDDVYINLFSEKSKTTIRFSFNDVDHGCNTFHIDIDDIDKDLVELVLIYGRDIQWIKDHKVRDLLDLTVHFLKCFAYL